MRLWITSNAPGNPVLILLNEDVETDYKLLKDAEWGDVVWTHTFSGATGTQGARPAAGKPENRPVVLPLRVTGIDKDDLAANIDDLQRITDELRRYGGTITWQSNSQSVRQHFTVLTSNPASVKEWGTRAENIYRATMVLEAQCAPYLLGDPLDWTDDFSTDWIVAANNDYGLSLYSMAAADDYAVTLPGAFCDIGPESGTERILILDREYTQPCVQAQFSGAEGDTDFKAGLILRWDGADATSYDDRIDCYVGFDGADYTLNIDRLSGSGTTNLATTTITGDLEGPGGYWLRARMERNAIYFDQFTSEPTPLGTPEHSATCVLDSDSEITGVGEELALKVGLVAMVTPAGAPAEVLNFSAKEYVRYGYSGAVLTDRLTAPTPAGYLDGEAFDTAEAAEAPALAELEITTQSETAFALASWHGKPGTYNLVNNGHFATDTSGWTTTAVSGICAAVTSITRGTTYWSGGGWNNFYVRDAASATVVHPATADSGASYRIYREFKAGVSYCAIAHVNKQAGTNPSLYLRLGNGALSDYASGSTTTVTSIQWLTVAVQWTPEQNCAYADLAVNNSLASSVTIGIDCVSVYEVNDLDRLEDFYMVRPLRVLETQADGYGAQPPIGKIEAASADSLTTWAITADSDYSCGYGLQLTAAGSGTATAAWYVDPNLLTPDDYTRGEIDIEVYARIEADGDLVAPKLTAYTYPLEVGADYGPTRYTHEYGSDGKYIVETSGTGAVFRTVKLGTLTFAIDREHPLRWGLAVQADYSTSSAGVFGIDYLLLAPTASCATSPTGEALDSAYPQFSRSASETTKTIRSDLSAVTQKPNFGPVPDHGLGGSLLEGNFDYFTLKLTDLVPDDPTSDATSETLNYDYAVHVAVTPRYHFLRRA